MIAELVASGYGGWDEIESTWGMVRTRAMHKLWREVCPPTHVSAAIFAGTYKAKPKAPKLETFEDFVAFAGASGAQIAPSPFPSLEPRPKP